MNSGINPKEKDYELARENTVAMNCTFSMQESFPLLILWNF